MSFQPTSSLSALYFRAEILEKLRYFFKSRQVLEVDTPILGLAPVTDPYLHALKTKVQHFSGQTFYLQTSPEYYLKRLIAAYPISVYQLGKVFRDDEYGHYHSPEFTLLEWYRLGFNDHDLMAEVAELLKFLVDGLPSTSSLPSLCLEAIQENKWRDRQAHDFFGLKLSYQAAFEEYLHLNPHQVSLEVLQGLVREQIGPIPGLAQPDSDTCLQLLMSHVIEPVLSKIQCPVFIYDFPQSQAALAQLKNNSDGWPVAARFEVYWQGIELANAYYELGDESAQRQRFQTDLKTRKQQAIAEVPLDERLLEALVHGLPSCSGVALGFDRLLMILMGASHIQEVLSFHTF